jgi:hypothetical protein
MNKLSTDKENEKNVCNNKFRNIFVPGVSLINLNDSWAYLKNANTDPCFCQNLLMK